MPPSTPSDASVSMPHRRILAPLGRANPLHRRPRRSPLNRRAARRRHPCLAVLLDAAVYTHELGRAAIHAPVRPRRAFLGRLPCAGEVAVAAQVCRATARTLLPAELDQAVGRARCTGRGRAGPGWAAGGFGPVAFDYIFIFSEYIQVLANAKIYV
jgi:hypothetical protein